MHVLRRFNRAMGVAGVLLICAVSAAAAEIYRHVDARGKVVFTDQPVEGAEAVSLPKMNTLPAAKTADNTANPQADVFAGYRAIVLSGVEANATLRNPNDAITITARPEPALQSGDRLLIRHNGAPVTADNGSYTMAYMERGTHTFSAEIQDAEGHVLFVGDSLSIHVQRTSVIRASP